METAFCHKCGQDRPLDAFSRDGSRKSGRDPQCKACKSAYTKANTARFRERKRQRAQQDAERIKRQRAQHYQKNAERIRAKTRQHSRANPEKRRARYQAYPQSKKDSLSQKSAAHYQKNRDHISAQHKVYAQENAPRLRAYKAQWVKDNPEKQHASKSRRRARERNAPFVEAVSLNVIYTRDRGICQICSQPCTRREASRDHVIPLTEGGEHSYRNCVLAHRFCNSKKGARRIPQQQRLFG